MVVYRGDDNYVKLVELAHRRLRQIEFAKVVFPVQPAYPCYGNTVLGAPVMRPGCASMGGGRRAPKTAVSRLD